MANRCFGWKKMAGQKIAVRGVKTGGQKYDKKMAKCDQHSKLL